MLHMMEICVALLLKELLKKKAFQSTFSHFCNKNGNKSINQTIPDDKLSILLTAKNVVLLQEQSLCFCSAIFEQTKVKSI